MTTTTNTHSGHIRRMHLSASKQSTLLGALLGAALLTSMWSLGEVVSLSMELAQAPVDVRIAAPMADPVRSAPTRVSSKIDALAPRML
jgi:hypothetical protein